VILNEAAVRRMRSNTLNHSSLAAPWVPRNLRVVGIVKDALTNAPFAREAGYLCVAAKLVVHRHVPLSPSEQQRGTGAAQTDL